MAALGPVPFAAMMMADMGAEIVTITPPPGRAASVPEERESHHNNPLWRGRSRLAHLSQLTGNTEGKYLI